MVALSIVMASPGPVNQGPPRRVAPQRVPLVEVTLLAVANTASCHDTTSFAVRAHDAVSGCGPPEWGTGGIVNTNELILGVNIALGSQPLSTCPSFDCQGDGVGPGGSGSRDTPTPSNPSGDARRRLLRYADELAALSDLRLAW
jgi:hypothetical protein